MCCAFGGDHEQMTCAEKCRAAAFARRKGRVAACTCVEAQVAARARESRSDVASRFCMGLYAVFVG